MGFSSYGPWAQELWRMSLADPQHVESSRTRDGAHVPGIGRQILNQWTTREVLNVYFYENNKTVKSNRLGEHLATWLDLKYLALNRKCKKYIMSSLTQCQSHKFKAYAH